MQQIRTPATPANAHPAAIALSVTVGRNQLVQAFGLTTVGIVCLGVMPWPFVLGWLAAALVTVGAEDRLLRRVASGAAPGWGLRFAAPTLRVCATSLYAAAAFALLAKGIPAQRLFAFALMSASVVHVLMRYYRSTPILLASIAPYLVVVGLVCFNLARPSLAEGHLLAALAAIFTIPLVAVQLWSARAQLWSVWGELLSAREAAEERERAAQAASLAKSQFLATMSHELRTPLNGVIGMAQALTSESLTRDQRERIAIIRRSSESLLAVLNDLVDLSKIETSSLELEIVEFDLEQLAAGVVAAFEPLAVKKNLTFACTFEAGASGRYLGDSARIRRILYSLTDNAVKFTETGGVSIQISRAGSLVRFAVADTGIGICKADLEHLFENFFQADGGLSRRYSGTGVGLALSDDLATLMGGGIEAKSEAGKGSVFTLALPLRPIARTQVAEVHTTEDRPIAGGLRVLAAEDNYTNQQVLKAMLGALGIRPSFVVDGREAVAAWENQTWDIILMDIQMPVMDGVEATRLIRWREGETMRARTPIVALTANAMAHQVAEYQGVGMDGVVAKPVDIATLLGAMESVLGEPGVIEPEIRSPAGQQGSRG